jgi:hypothetical protein
MWPNWTLSLFNGGMNTSRINPISHNQTELIYNFYFADLSDTNKASRKKTIADNLEVVREDFEVCLEPQKNYVSGGYRPGPLSPRHEKGVAYFQDRLKASLVQSTAAFKDAAWPRVQTHDHRLTALDGVAFRITFPRHRAVYGLVHRTRAEQMGPTCRSSADPFS